MKIDQVRLTAAPGISTIQPGDPVPELGYTDTAWFTAARRRWPTVTARYGETAPDIAQALCRANAITIHANVNHDLRLTTYTSTTPTPAWAAWHATRAAAHAAHADSWTARAAAAADTISDLDEQLAAALCTTPGRHPHLPVLVHAAEALADGTVFDGPRAFSQAFFGDTKARDDAPVILTRHGADPDTLAALGLTRSPYLGAGGRVTAHLTGRDPLDLTGIPGPTQFRAHPNLRFTVPRPGITLLIIENLQAAETICDRHSDLAVLWCVGQPSNTALRILADTADAAAQVTIATDADLGGVRIAHRIATALRNDPATVTILDAGASPHPDGGQPFGPATHTALRRVADSESPAAELARGCLERGYRVEQEAVIRASITDYLQLPKATPSADPGHAKGGGRPVSK